MAARHRAAARLRQGTTAGDRDRRPERPGDPQPERRDLAGRGARPDLAGPGRGVERLRPDARHGRLRAPAGGAIRLLGPATYAAPLAAGPHRVAAPRLQPVLRTDLSAGAHQLLERYRARPGHAVAAPRDALRDRTPPTALAAPRIPDG